MAFREFEAVFGEVEAEWEQQQHGAGARRAPRPFLYCARALDTARVQVAASDFHSTFERVLTVSLLEDLRDNTGIGGSWSEFFDYFISYLSSGNIRLVLSGLPNMTFDSGALHATLIAHNSKSKVFPPISLSLNKLMNSSANDVMADLSIATFRKFKSNRICFVKEQERCLRLMKMLSLEKNRNESLQKQLDAHSSLGKRKVPTPQASDKASPISNTLSYPSTTVSETQKTLDTPSPKDPVSMKHSQQATSEYSRSKFEVPFLKDN